MRLHAWWGPTRLSKVDYPEGLPVTGWSWSEKYGEMPSGKLSANFPATLWPKLVSDPLRPMGQYLKCEIVQGDHVTPLPPVRIIEACEGVTVTADSMDRDIADDPWPYPSSPATGSSLAREAGRLAAPIPVRLGIPDTGLPDGLAWSGDRDEALLELALMRSAQWRLDPTGALILVPLGNPHEPERHYTARDITAASRKLKRERPNKVTVIAEAAQSTAAEGEEEAEAAPLIIVRRLSHPAYAPELYGTIGHVETLAAGAGIAEAEEAADALLAESGGEREFSILADPTLRAGMVARFDVEHADGDREKVLGRVMSHTITHTGAHTVTVREA